MHPLQAENEVEQQEWMQMLQARGGKPPGRLVRHISSLIIGVRCDRRSSTRVPTRLPHDHLLQGVIACLLSGAVDHEAIPTRPVRPTHSRT